MSNDTHKNLIQLGDTLAEHMHISHWRIAFLARGDGQFFKRLRDGKSCTLRTAVQVMDWFDTHWPADLEWPKSIPRPSTEKRVA